MGRKSRAKREGRQDAGRDPVGDLLELLSGGWKIYGIERDALMVHVDLLNSEGDPMRFNVPCGKWDASPYASDPVWTPPVSFYHV